MEVVIKAFDVAMEIKNKGIELDVKDPNGAHRGDLIITKTQLIWCEGKTRREKGKKMTWDDFIATMNK